MSRITAVQRGTNAELVATVSQLYSLDGPVLDLTHGKSGGFWKVRRPEGLVAVKPGDGIDFRSTSWAAGSFRNVIFDPPYVTKGGHSTSTIHEMNDRYGMLHVERTPKLQWERQIVPGIREAHRLLEAKGRLWFKCMDYVTSGRVYWFTKLALPALLDIGFKLEDEFTLDSPPGPQPTINLDGTPRYQCHSAQPSRLLIAVKRTPRQHRVRSIGTCS